MKAEVINVNGKPVMEITPETPIEYVQSQNWLRKNMKVVKGENPYLDVMSFDLKMMEK